MEKNRLMREAEAIIADKERDYDDRMRAIIVLREEIEIEDKMETLKADAFIFARLIEAIKGEGLIAAKADDLFELYALLAETYDDMEDYRALARLAFEVRETLRDERIAWEVLEDTLPSIIDAMKNSVYHHETCNLLLVYIQTAFKAGELDERMKGQVRYFLKLQLLLEYNGWSRHWLTRELEDRMASLFTREELLKIILHPEIGHLKVDPVEYTHRWEEIYYDVERKLEERFANAPRHHGFCFRYWQAKRELLKEEYGIDWHSPSQMNPGVMFD